MKGTKITATLLTAALLTGSWGVQPGNVAKAKEITSQEVTVENVTLTSPPETETMEKSNSLKGALSKTVASPASITASPANNEEKEILSKDTYKDIKWTLYIDGSLEVTGTGEILQKSLHTNHLEAPWADDAHLIKTAKIDVKNFTNL
ncbi:MAG: hypothetical protein IIT46_08775, partial [Lachnospiraceae bacterium]|nr:hypothetical protein [Lachnospiraceae bacterium]